MCFYKSRFHFVLIALKKKKLTFPGGSPSKSSSAGAVTTLSTAVTSPVGVAGFTDCDKMAASPSATVVGDGASGWGDASFSSALGDLVSGIEGDGCGSPVPGDSVSGTEGDRWSSPRVDGFGGDDTSITVSSVDIAAPARHEHATGKKKKSNSSFRLFYA